MNLFFALLSLCLLLSAALGKEMEAGIRVLLFILALLAADVAFGIGIR
jgi:hypothetical protein